MENESDELFQQIVIENEIYESKLGYHTKILNDCDDIDDTQNFLIKIKKNQELQQFTNEDAPVNNVN